MRWMLIAAAATFCVAAPASAQRPSDRIAEYAPAIDRMTQAFLDLDLGPLLDAADPYRPHRVRTLRQMARRDDPQFDRRLRGSIYGSAAMMGRMADSIAAAEPAMRHAAEAMRRDMEAAIAGAPPLPQGQADDDWDLDLDEDGAPYEPYEPYRN